MMVLPTKRGSEGQHPYRSKQVERTLLDEVCRLFKHARRNADRQLVRVVSNPREVLACRVVLAKAENLRWTEAGGREGAIVVLP